jgi:hypothetical protein
VTRAINKLSHWSINHLINQHATRTTDVRAEGARNAAPIAGSIAKKRAFVNFILLQQFGVEPTEPMNAGDEAYGQRRLYKRKPILMMLVLGEEVKEVEKW